MPHRIDQSHGSAFTSDIKFDLGITPFGGITLAGSQDWFELLKAANVYSVRRKAQPSYNKADRRRKRYSRSKSMTLEGDKLTEDTKPLCSKTIEREIDRGEQSSPLSISDEMNNNNDKYSSKQSQPKSTVIERDSSEKQPGRSKSKTNDQDKPSKSKTAEKKTSALPAKTPLNLAEQIKPRIPVINIIKASNESIPDLYISESSDEESDSEYDDQDFVYEFPGFAASAEDMTVENPLFQEKQFQSSYRTPELPKKFWKDVFVESV